MKGSGNNHSNSNHIREEHRACHLSGFGNQVVNSEHEQQRQHHRRHTICVKMRICGVSLVTRWKTLLQRLRWFGLLAMHAHAIGDVDHDLEGVILSAG